MNSMKIFYTPGFNRQHKGLDVSIQKSFARKILLFRKNPFSSLLKTHKLSGKMSGLWAFSVDFRNRAVFSFEDADSVWFYQIGDHDIYE